ncbi:MAG: Hemin-binding periplasmic protein HmuT precursor [Syntrophorhabdus sp. PtaU1.Bin002]|nr:MAG: Hemin-binding periplasmic protein HmuT precursor [Syntrophorhabdus sp. PtaU1.Bin002]
MKKHLLLVFVCTVCLWIISQNGYSQTPDPIRQKRTIVDMSGKTVMVPRIVNRIVVTCQGGASHEISVLGCADKIIAQPSMKSFPQLLKMYPRLNNIPNAGSFDTVNVEHIMTLKPDIVVASVTSLQGNKKIESLGIPVVTVSTGRANIDRLLREFKMMSEILGGTKQADALVRYWNDRLSLIRKRTAAISEATRKKVFYASSGSSFTTESELGWGHYFVTASGGINVSRSLKNERGVVGPEQLLVWNPDVIITRSDKDLQGPGSVMQGAPRFKGIKAVKDNAVYPCPIGAFWWDRPSPEAILGIIWLAKTLYPEVMADIDLRKEAMLFYKTFYGYALTDRDDEAFF